MVLQSVERRLERMVEGVFARAFRSSLKPIELGKRMLKVMDAQRSVDVKGRKVVPNAFTFVLSAEDARSFDPIHDALVAELVEAAKEYAAEEGYGFMGPVSVTLEVDHGLRAGRFECEARLQQAQQPIGFATLLLPTGERVRLGEEGLVIGRLPECGVVLTDPNVSRRHAEIRPAGAGYLLTDLRSTNGTRVNGAPVTEQRLSPGDVITIGSTELRYETT